MNIDLITLFPEIFNALDYGIVGRAIERKLIAINAWNPRDYTTDVHRTVDDRPYGGGPGMVMKYEPLADAIKAAQASHAQKPLTIYLSPQGSRLTQPDVKHFAEQTNLILICGRYEGIDERVIEKYVDEEWSIGDYVLSGGELPAMVLIDAITRLLPGALGHELSAEQDSFSESLLDCPHYTRPEQVDGMSVPPVLLSGDHAAISRWRHGKSVEKTWQMRPDLIKSRFAEESSESEELKPQEDNGS